VELQSKPDVEQLELRQVPAGSFSTTAVSCIHLAPYRLAAADTSPLTLLQSSPTGNLGQPAPPTAGTSGPGSAPDAIANNLPTAPVGADTGTPSPPPALSSPSQAANNPASPPGLKAEAAGTNNAGKLFSAPEHAAANASLASQDPTVAYSLSKLVEKMAGNGLFPWRSDEFIFHAANGLAANARPRGALLTAATASASPFASPAEKQLNEAVSRSQREHSAPEWTTPFWSAAYDPGNGVLSSGLAKGAALDTQCVEKHFSSARYGPPNARLPVAGGGLFHAKPAEALLVGLWDALAGLGTPLLHTVRPEQKPQADDADELYVPPLYFSVLLYRQSGKPLDPSAQQGLERLCAYAWLSIRNAERVYGEKILCPEDVVQEIYLEWRGLVGPQPEDEALARLLQDGSEEMKCLRVAVQRVIGRIRYQQRQWTKAIALTEPEAGSAAFACRGEQERVDWEDLWENVVSTVSPREKEILELRKQGQTFAEIGSALGVSRQRACETYHSVVARLQKTYPDW
jgi:DNA-directed RNA polymerase specialized sigma24 family protein